MTFVEVTEKKSRTKDENKFSQIRVVIGIFGTLYDGYSISSDKYIYNETTVGTGPGIRTS